ncbi:MAG: class I SAM-dependent methyltransferase [Gammaproteobacteria bacterium]|nr:class I SAM-dependent methyltransferase [Gammaproteobacteria bacterium]
MGVQRRRPMKDASWLQPWIEEIYERAAGNYVLELGCGEGLDSSILSAQGLEFISIDIDFESLTNCSQIQGCQPINADLSSKLPFPDNAFNFVLASLSLHYFSWKNTLEIVYEIRRVLTPEGMILIRVNSTKDINFGAGVGEEIEKNYYLNSERKKRFFDKTAVETVLAGMNIRSLLHETIDRYGKDKQVWVACAEA